MSEDSRTVERQRLVDAIAAAATRNGLEALDAHVLHAMATVPREQFVPDTLRAEAYRDRPLPIGAGQTISQPFIVALMTHLLHIGGRSRVLEIGTGCGYQTAVLAEIAAEVFTLEVIPALHAAAVARLSGLGYANIRARLGDGWEGWPEAAPFDAIIVTAAAPRVPEKLAAQLADGGRLVLPVGLPGGRQWLRLVERSADGLTESDILSVTFVPMVERGADGP